MKKIINNLVVSLFTGLLIVCIGSFVVYSEDLSAADVEEIENNEEYYSTLCYRNSSKLSNEEKLFCSKFYAYMETKNNNLIAELETLKNSQAEIESNIEAYLHKIREYDAIIENYELQIKDINESVADMESEIDYLNKLIDEQTIEVHEKSEKIRNKMVKMQGFIGANYTLNFIFSAHDLEDLIKRFNDIKYFNEYEVNALHELNEKKNELLKAKEDIETVYKTIDEQRESLKESQTLVREMRSQSSSILISYRHQQAELVAKEMTQRVTMEKYEEIINEFKKHSNDVHSSLEWISPIENRDDYWISAGVWEYPEDFGGGLHLGLDLAAEKGTELRAPANGIVLYSSNACEADGELGDKCGKPGVAYGGNQVTLLVLHMNRTYAISFFHMLYDTPLPIGTVVSAGDLIGEVGMSGNVTGPHTHIEMHDLGYISFEDFIDSWDGDLSFGNEWGNDAKKHLCDDQNDETVLACRMNPYVLVAEQIEEADQ